MMIPVMQRIAGLGAVGFIFFAALPVRAAGFEELKIKREAVFEFASKPSVTCEDDRVTIAFETKGFCDCTIAIENDAGKIVRHLVSGVLGANAPAPFIKGTKRQSIVWDGKDDQGRYVDNKDTHTVRVSLGLKPRFERSLFWSPHKQMQLTGYPLVSAQPEGVYVYEGQGADYLRLYSHQGKYLRTIYPFPAEKLKDVKGLTWHTFKADGARFPLKHPTYDCTLLTSGKNAALQYEYVNRFSYGAATGMVVQGERIALASLFLNRLATDGTTGGLNLTGPKTFLPVLVHRKNSGKRAEDRATPSSLAFSPDGKKLYMTGYEAIHHFGERLSGAEFLHAVMVMDFEKDDEPRVFAGSTKQKESGTDNRHFKVPTSVTCDAAGRVYVSDYMNDRIQVFAPDGTYLKSIPSLKPALVRLNPKTGEMYVFSWLVRNYHFKSLLGIDNVKSTVTHLGPVENPKVLGRYDLPSPNRMSRYYYTQKGSQYNAEVDFHTSPATIWLGLRRGRTFLQHFWSNESLGKGGLILLQPKDGKWVKTLDFGEEAKKLTKRLEPAVWARQRLSVNPATGKLYIGENQGGHTQRFRTVVEVDPETGAQQEVKLPYDTEDLVFDSEGRAYCRQQTLVGRYDPATWREIPFDYGEERVLKWGSTDASVISVLPVASKGLWKQGGISVSPTGNILMAFLYKSSKNTDRRKEAPVTPSEKKYETKLYEGRLTMRKSSILSIWDQHGTLVQDDVVPGLDVVQGVHLSRNNEIYLMCTGTRVFNGERYFDGRSGSVIKFLPGKARIFSASKHNALPLPKENTPKGVPDLIQSAGTFAGPAWVKGAEWFYGGVGFDPMKCLGPKPGQGASCNCPSSRFTADYYDRSFAPEMARYSVAVLDPNGNLMLRVGRYGNVDDGLPLATDTFETKTTKRSMGGDETALIYPAYLATHTDRRLFIADIGNARIVSVRLGYHTEARIALSDAPESKAEK